MSTDFKKLTLENFASGAATELFERELANVLDNIDDPNTKPETARQITLTFTIKPDEMRDQAALSVEAKSKLAPVRQAIGTTFFGKTNGKMTAYAQDIRQMEFDVQQQPAIVNQEAN